MGLTTKFADNNAYALSQIILTAQSNQADLNVIVQENDGVRASSVVFQVQGLTANPANPIPVVTIVGQNTIGAAVGGVDQPIDNPLDETGRNRFDPNE